MRALLLCIILSGCATCREHPVACTAVAAIVVTSIAVSQHHDYHSQPYIQRIQK